MNHKLGERLALLVRFLIVINQIEVYTTISMHTSSVHTYVYSTCTCSESAWEAGATPHGVWGYYEVLRMKLKVICMYMLCVIYHLSQIPGLFTCISKRNSCNLEFIARRLE